MAETPRRANLSAELPAPSLLSADGNGKVSKKEWQTGIFKNKKLLAKHFGGASLGEIGAAFARIDENGDLSLSFEEFRSGARSLAAAVKISDSLATPQGHAELRELFKRLVSQGTPPPARILCHALDNSPYNA